MGESRSGEPRQHRSDRGNTIHQAVSSDHQHRANKPPARPLHTSPMSSSSITSSTTPTSQSTDVGGSGGSSNKRKSNSSSTGNGSSSSTASGNGGSLTSCSDVDSFAATLYGVAALNGNGLHDGTGGLHNNRGLLMDPSHHAHLGKSVCSEKVKVKSNATNR